MKISKKFLLKEDTSNQNSQFLTSVQEIEYVLEDMGIKNYTINDDLTVDVKGDVTIQLRNIKNIPIRFNKVSGDFDCRKNQLTSLQGAPQEVGGNFNCRNNQLTSLQGAPQKVSGRFDVDDNLKSELRDILKAQNTPQAHEKELDKKYNIESPSLYNIALILSRDYGDDTKVPIKELKKKINSDNYLGQMFTKKDGQGFLRNFSNGFSINDIIEYDKKYHSGARDDSFLNSLKIGEGLEIGFDIWKKEAQTIFKEKKNYVFQLNFSKEITDRLITDSSEDTYTISGEHEGIYHEIETSNKNNINAYIQKSNHPTSKELLTMGWVRFTLFPEKHSLVIDEIQTDLTSDKFLGEEIMKGWEDILMKAFIKYARNELNYQKIYMPTYKTKLDLYDASPPMRLYKELPNRFGFKTKSDWEGFMVLERKIMTFKGFLLK